MNLIKFHNENEIKVEKINISSSRKEELEESLLLYFTGLTRKAQDIEKNKIENISKREEAKEYFAASRFGF